MKKNLEFLVMGLGVIANILILTKVYLFGLQTVLGLILGAIGAIIAICNYNKISAGKNRIIMIVSGIICAFPVLYFGFLLLAIG